MLTNLYTIYIATSLSKLLVISRERKRKSFSGPNVRCHHLLPGILHNFATAQSCRFEIKPEWAGCAVILSLLMLYRYLLLTDAVKFSVQYQCTGNTQCWPNSLKSIMCNLVYSHITSKLLFKIRFDYCGCENVHMFKC